MLFLKWLQLCCKMSFGPQRSNFRSTRPNFRFQNSTVKKSENDRQEIFWHAFVYVAQDAVFGQESVANDISDYYGDKSNEKEVRQFCEVHNQVATTLFHQFVSSFTVCSREASPSPCPSKSPSHKNGDVDSTLKRGLKIRHCSFSAGIHHNIHCADVTHSTNLLPRFLQPHYKNSVIVFPLGSSSS